MPAACPDRRVISAVIRPGHNTRGHNYRQLANQDNHGNHIMRPGPYSSLQDGCTGLSRASGIYRTQPASRRPEKLCQVPWVRARVAGRLAATAHPVDASCMLCVVPPMAAILVANGARPPPAIARVSRFSARFRETTARSCEGLPYLFGRQLGVLADYEWDVRIGMGSRISSQAAISGCRVEVVHYLFQVFIWNPGRPFRSGARCLQSRRVIRSGPGPMRRFPLAAGIRIDQLWNEIIPGSAGVRPGARHA